MANLSSRVKIKNQRFDEERALYNLSQSDVIDCIFAGPADGESALKEVRDVNVVNCEFSLRYPLWHAAKFSLIDSVMDSQSRAPIWYSEDGNIKGCQIDGPKLLRECRNIRIEDSVLLSAEFGWRCHDLDIVTTRIESEYLLFGSSQIKIDQLHMQGKYSFQYVEQMHIKDSVLETKDAFWHSKNVTIENSVVKGEYLGWFSENLTLINCRIIGTQPLCYCENLMLINCTMEDTDLAFEYSDVDADINGHIVSIKNPKSGIISADSVREIIRDNSVMELKAEIKIKKQTSVI
ncbi:MAG: hypothetical protein CL609_21945 [Anaerolineaceae bacterium]|nr:hypothetical protein [Anaerolineaceae bacterium]